ncbi:MAG: cation diffusion facilitator family transporter [Acidimicrobiia bacterium]
MTDETHAHSTDHGPGHDHGPNPALLASGAEGIRATKVSLIGLGLTALAQFVIVLVSGSVALLSDTLHNIGDAATAIPLWIAFSVGMRPATRRYTFGLGRAEDVAGIVIVAAIGLSAALIAWESVNRLIEPEPIRAAGWVIAAGFVGALGNEWVARYRMRVGRRIGSEALVADGRHARSDALTSLAVVVAGVGALFGLAWVDPVAGLVVAGAIVVLLVRSGRVIVRRLLDGIEPELVDRARAALLGTEGVEGVADLRMRWQGHLLRVEASIGVDPDLSVAGGHEIGHAAEHALHHEFDRPLVVTVHVEPADRSGHEDVSHHTGG